MVGLVCSEVVQSTVCPQWEKHAHRAVRGFMHGVWALGGMHGGYMGWFEGKVGFRVSKVGKVDKKSAQKSENTAKIKNFAFFATFWSYTASANDKFSQGLLFLPYGGWIRRV
jgi:hypothetical protein